MNPRDWGNIWEINMSYDDDDYTDGTDLVKKLRSKIDELSKVTKELQSENESLKASERKRSVASVLEGKGLNPKIAAFIPSDLDPTEENLDQWIDEYADVFGVTLASQDEQPTQVVSNAEQADAARRMNAAERDASPTIQSSGDVVSMIANADSMDELMSILRSGG